MQTNFTTQPKFLVLAIMLTLTSLSAVLLYTQKQPVQAGHVSCGDTITANTTLDADLLNCPGDGLVIGANSITLDCAGFSITGSNVDNGIEIPSGFGSVTVINCDNVSNFDRGISIRGTGGNTIGQSVATGNNFNNNDLYGVDVATTSPNTFTGNNFDNNDSRGGISQTRENTFTSNTFSNNGGNGFHIINCPSCPAMTGSTLTSNTANGNDGCGFHIVAGYDTLTSNTANNNGDGVGTDGGFCLVSADDATLTSNTANNNTGRGFYLQTATNNTLTSNSADGNSNEGFRLQSTSTDNTLTNNISTNNTQSGYIISAAVDTDNSLTGNVADNNGSAGIIASGTDTVLTSNVVTNNDATGIQLSGDSIDMLTNYIYNNAFGGVGARGGIGLFNDADSNTLTGNVIVSNDVAGVRFQNNNDSNTLTDNIVVNNNASGIQFASASDVSNSISNNYLNNGTNASGSNDNSNVWNIAKTLLTNIVNGINKGGNYFGAADQTGFSETCADTDNDDICDTTVSIGANMVDNLPLQSVCLTQPSGIAGWWPGDANASNFEGSGSNGTLIGDTAFATAASGNGFSFDGTGDAVDLGDSLDSVTAGADEAFTIAFWTKLDTLAVAQLFGKIGDATVGSENQRQFAVQTKADGTVQFDFHGALDGSQQRTVDVSYTKLKTNALYHITVSYDGSIDTNDGLDRVKIYIDTFEQKKTLSTTTGALGDIPDGSAKLAIGGAIASNNATGYHVDGLVDEVLVFDRVLSAAEVKSLYTSGSKSLCGKFCGDSIIVNTESCDDGNTVAGDGCNADCSLVESGWSCAGEASFCKASWTSLKASRGFGNQYDIGTVDASFLGEVSNNLVSFSGDGVGDINNDGFADFAFGGSGHNSSAGKAYLVFGKPSGWSFDTALSTVDASWVGEAASDVLGAWVEGIGDVNGDGFDDMAVSAYFNSEGPGSNAGQVYIIFGRAASDPYWTTNKAIGTTADASFLGEASGDNMGFSIAGVGDVNNDNFDDFVIGSHLNDEGPGNDDDGQAYLIFGRAASDPFWAMDKAIATSADASWLGEGTDDNLGFNSGGAGDVNGDGFDDILLGAHTNEEFGTTSGQGYLIFGRATADPYWAMDKPIGTTADASFLPEGVDDRLSFGIEGIGDVNGDNFDDIIMGAVRNNEGPGNDNAGQTYVFFGKASGWAADTSVSTADASFIGEAVSDFSSYYADGLGDINKDGFDDFAIAALFNDQAGADAGKIYVILGKSSGWTTDVSLSQSDASFLGEVAGDSLGYVLTGVGDVDGNGSPDFITSAYINDETDTDAGQLYLILSPNVIVPDSPSAPPPCPAVSGSIQTFTAQLGQSGDNSTIDLNWTLQGTGANERLTLYRGVGEGLTLPQMLPIASSLLTDQTSYQDVFTQTADYGQTYTYALQLHNSCGNTQNPQFSDPFTLPNRYSDGTEINMELQLSVKVKEVRDQLLLDRIQEILTEQNGSASLNLNNLVAQAEGDISFISNARAQDIDPARFKVRIKDAIHNLFFPENAFETADPLKQDFYEKNKEFLFHRAVGHFVESDNLEPTDSELQDFIKPIVDEILNELGQALSTEQALRQKLEAEGLHTIDPNSLTSIEQILNNPNLKAAILSIPEIENLIKGHSESVLLEVWNPGDRNTPVFSQQITTNIFGEASVTLPNFVTGTYDFTLKLPGTLRKSVPIQKANTDTLVLNFSGDDAGLKFGDFNDDGSINLDDIKFLRTGFAQNPDQFDLNEDGKFDLSDVFETLKNYGTE